MFSKNSRIFKPIYWLREKIYYERKPLLVLNATFNKVPEKEALDLITIAFNNPHVISYQIRLLRKYLIDPYHYTVADNSNDKEKSEAIMSICKKENIQYIRLPKNPYSTSMSHGVAMNWVHKNYILKRGLMYFGFIDHDIFPTSKTSIIHFLKKQPVYGCHQERNGIWYLWAGFAFFKLGENYEPMNFKKGFINKTALDTGGMNWENVYSKIDMSGIRFAEHYYKTIRTTNKTAQSDQVEFIGGWLHLFNASNRMNVPEIEERNLILNEMLDNLITK